MDHEKIIRSYLKRYQDMDRKGTPYYFTILFGYNGTNHTTKLTDHKNSDTSSDLFEQSLEDARKYEADYIIVREYSSSNAPGHKPINGKSGFKINLTDSNYSEYKVKDERLSASAIINRASGNFEKRSTGLEGPEGHLEYQRTMMKTDYQIMVLENENKKLEKENSSLKGEKEKLEKENDELIGKCEELVSIAQDLKKYDPGEFKMLGVNPIPLGAAIIERSIKNFAIKNPTAVSKLTGISPSELTGFLQNENNEEGTLPPQQDVNNIQQTSKDQDAQLNETQQRHLQVATAIYEWLKSITTGNLKKVHEIITYFYKGEGETEQEKLDEVYEFINQNTDNDE